MWHRLQVAWIAISECFSSIWTRTSLKTYWYAHRISEKWNMPKKEDVVSEIIEKAVPVPDNSAQDYSDVPVYYEPFSYAKESDEVDLYRTSYRLNSECKQAIHEAIADNYDGMYLGDGAVDQVVRQSRSAPRSIMQTA